MTLELDALETSLGLVAAPWREARGHLRARLFAAAPAVVPLFAATDLRRQKSMLLATFVLLRKSLRDPDKIVPALRDLGASHVTYGARAEHYLVVGEVLIASMAEVARTAWRPEYQRRVGGGLRDRRRRDARRCRGGRARRRRLRCGRAMAAIRFVSGGEPTR
jgi:nitric oxide dioxygenase